MPGPNGEPSGMSDGAWAVTPPAQHGHLARNRLIRVVIGLIGQIDVVPGPRELLTCRGEHGAARAALGVDVTGHVRGCGERSRGARTALAPSPCSRRLGDTALLAARRRQRRVVRRLRRLAVLERRDPRQQRLVLPYQLRNPIRELAVATQQLLKQRLHFVGKTSNLLRIHTNLESARCDKLNAPTPIHTVAGGE